MMNFNVVLFKDSNCDLCKLMQQELMDNPPNCSVKIVHVGREGCNYETGLYDVTRFPTTLILNNEKVAIKRFEGFIDSKTINKILKEYETECVV